MVPLACAATLVLWCAVSVAGRRRDPCDELAVEVATGWMRMDEVRKFLYRLRFNVFEESATRVAGSVSWADRRELTSDLWNEDLIWGRQAAILKHVASEIGFGDGYLALIYVFHLSRRTQTRFFRAEDEVFVVRSDGSFEHCGPLVGGDGNLTRRVLGCGGCRAFFEFPLHTKTLAVEWSNFCRTSSDRYTAREPDPSFGVVCPEELAATGRPTAGFDAETLTATDPVLVPTAIAVVILAVAFALFAFRGRLGRFWLRWRGSTADPRADRAAVRIKPRSDSSSYLFSEMSGREESLSAGR